MLDLRKQNADLAAGHQFDQFGFRDVPRRDRFNLAPVAQHRDAIGDLFDLPHAMRDVDYSNAGSLELGDQLEQFCRLGIGERGRRLVKDQKAYFGKERFRDLHHLLVCARQLRDFVIRRQVEVELADDGA